MDRSPKASPVQKYFARPGKERLAQAVDAVLDSGAIQESHEMARDFARRAVEAVDCSPTWATGRLWAI